MQQEEIYEENLITWDEINITVRYCSKRFGGATAHLEIKSDNAVALPITETGYRSHFIQAEIIEEYGGAVSYVLQWLDEKAQSKEWKIAKEQSKQLGLFD